MVENLLRLDDTDSQRTKEEYKKAIIDDFAWLGISYSKLLKQSDNLNNYEKAKNYALENSNKGYIMAGASETFHTVLAYIYHKEGNSKLAKDHFEKQKTMKNSITKWWIENYDFVNSRPTEFMNDYIKVLEKYGLPYQ